MPGWDWRSTTNLPGQIGQLILKPLAYPPGWDAMNHGLLTQNILKSGSTAISSVCTTGSSLTALSCHFYPLGIDVQWAQISRLTGEHVGNAVVFFANGYNGLAIAPAIVHEALGGDHPAFRWIKYDAYDSPNVRFIHDTVHNGAQTLSTYAPQLKDNTISEETINSAGYFLLRQKKYDDAIAVFNRCIELHPNSANAFNNLGETYAETGQTELAIKNYQRALELDPTRNDARAALDKLRSASSKIEAAH